MIESLPSVNAALNTASAILLVLGWRAIRARRVKLHARLMGSAFATSCLFLVSYVVYHAHAGSRVYEGPARGLYLAILGSHVVLAALVVPLALWTLVRALKGRFEAHRRIARWTLPVWLYVSVTGVVVYLMLYGL